MATEVENLCPICLDSWEEVSCILPCFHQFCYTCILQWAENTPECPLCKRRILFILHSVGAENNYMEHVIALSETPSVTAYQERGDPRQQGDPDLHCPGTAQPRAAEGVPRPPVSILQPEEWVMLFQDYPCLLDTLMPCVQPKLRQIFRNNRMEAALVEDTAMDVLANHGTDEDQLVQMLGISLQNHTVPFVQQLIHGAVQRCGRETCRLLAQQLHLPAQLPALLTALKDAPWMKSPLPPPLPWVVIPAEPPLLPLPLLVKSPRSQRNLFLGPPLPYGAVNPPLRGHSDPQRDRPAALGLPSQQEANASLVTLEDTSGVGQTVMGPPPRASASL